jgi:hypothetical protein
VWVHWRDWASLPQCLLTSALPPHPVLGFAESSLLKYFTSPWKLPAWNISVLSLRLRWTLMGGPRPSQMYLMPLKSQTILQGCSTNSNPREGPDKGGSSQDMICKSHSHQQSHFGSHRPAPPTPRGQGTSTRPTLANRLLPVLSLCRL